MLMERVLLLSLRIGVAAAIIRLTGGGADGGCRGRVEVFHDGRWGTVCDDWFGMADGQVVCRQLGCGTALSVFSHRAHYQGTIWMDRLACRGHEEALHLCPHRGFGIHGCGPNENAGVVCSGVRRKTVLRVHVTSDLSPQRVESHLNSLLQQVEQQLTEQWRVEELEAGERRARWTRQHDGAILHRDAERRRGGATSAQLC